jgi:hypothetical protein
MAALTDKKQRIIYYLTQGLKEAQVASIVGCTPAYISNLVNSDQDFQQALEQKQQELATTAATKTQAEVEEDFVSSQYLALENQLLTHMSAMASSADFKELTRAVEVIGSRQEKRAERLARMRLPHMTPQQTNIAVLMLPAHTAAQFQPKEVLLNEQKEIIAVGEQSMAPMSAQQVRNIFEANRPKSKAEAIVQQARAIEAEL